MIKIKLTGDTKISDLVTHYEKEGYILVEEQLYDTGHFLIFEKSEEVAKRLAAEAEAQAKRELAEIDIKSIRFLREWVAKQADAPQALKNFESQAVAEREKLTKEG